MSQKINAELANVSEKPIKGSLKRTVFCCIKVAVDGYQYKTCKFIVKQRCENRFWILCGLFNMKIAWFLAFRQRELFIMNLFCQ